CSRFTDGRRQRDADLRRRPPRQGRPAERDARGHGGHAGPHVQHAGGLRMSAVHDAVEKAVTIFFYCFLAALIAAGATFPPSAPVVYGPALLALLAGV